MAISGDPVKIGVSGLLAFQRAIATTGHNIVNSNTEGFSRQSVENGVNNPIESGSGFVGTGTNVLQVSRAYNEFIQRQLIDSTSSAAKFEKFSDLASNVDLLLSDPEAGISPSLQEFFNELRDVSNNPSSISSRKTLLAGAESLVERFHFMQDEFTAIQQQVNNEMKNITTQINSYTESLVDINNKLKSSSSLDLKNPPNDLLDQRDEMLKQLAQKIDIQIVEGKSGAVDIFVANGQALVVGAGASELVLSANKYDSSTQEISLKTSRGFTMEISESIKSGELGGILDFRDNALNQAQNALGRIAGAFTKSINDQHSLGLDLDSNQGSDFFEIGDGEAFSHINNTGNATIATTIDDCLCLTNNDYVLAYDGINWTITNEDTGDSFSTTNMAAGASFEGINFKVNSGAMNAGDSFLIRPTRNISSTMNLLISNPSKIAAASMVYAEANLNNSGSGAITQGSIPSQNPINANINNPVDIVFNNPPSTFDIIDVNTGTTLSAGNTYQSGQTISMNGWETTITGSPDAGDNFNVRFNSDAGGDNRNALALAAIQQLKLLDGGIETFEGAYGDLVSDMGTKTHQAEINRVAQASLLEQSQSKRDAFSGVNLDEEAAQLMRLQQAYQAAAQVVAMGNRMFDTLISKLG